MFEYHAKTVIFVMVDFILYFLLIEDEGDKFTYSNQGTRRVTLMPAYSSRDVFLDFINDSSP